MPGTGTRVRARVIVMVALVTIVLRAQAPGGTMWLGPAVTLAASQVRPGTALWTFDADPVGGLAAGARVLDGKWAVRRESDAPSRPNALCQTGVARFPAILLTSAPYANAVIEARFKPISGSEDRAGGIIFRVQDRDNYYILRANALEDNVILYKYLKGGRRGVASADVKVLTGKWQTLRVEAIASRIRGFLNGQRVLETRDETFKAGGIGLWTKADSETCFDNVRVTVL